MCCMTNSNLIIDAMIKVEVSDEEPKGLESQSQNLEIHSLCLAQEYPFRNNPMEEIEQNFLHSRESFKNPQDLVNEAKCQTSLKRPTGVSLVAPLMFCKCQI